MKKLLVVALVFLGFASSSQANIICFQDKLYDGTSVKRCMPESEYKDFRYQQRFNNMMLNGLSKKSKETGNKSKHNAKQCEQALTSLNRASTSFTKNAKIIGKKYKNKSQRRKAIKPYAKRYESTINQYEKACKSNKNTANYRAIMKKGNQFKINAKKKGLL